MDLADLENKLVAVLGYGLEGKATTKYLIKHGIKPVLFDQKPLQEWPVVEQEAIKSLGLNFIFGKDTFSELKGFNIAFRSPGIKLSELTTYNLQLTSQTKWFFEHCPSKIIGVTGTKGKGTTCALIDGMLKASGLNSHLIGNIGYTQPFDVLDNLNSSDWIVYELSSFQLQDLQRSPHIAVVLMITSEHLDYHKDVHEYVDAKSAISKFQSAKDFTIINSNYESSVDIGHLGKGNKLIYNTLPIIDALEKSGDCFVSEGKIYLKNRPLLETAQLQLRGSHNLQNVCAAALAATAAGCSRQAVKKEALSFRGLEHRLEFVAEKEGIKFYNDSFSTTPETAIAAIKSFTEPEVIILGGSSKNADFSELAKTIVSFSNIKAAILFGQEGPAIKHAILQAGQFNGKIVEGAASMREVFKKIRGEAVAGDVVILSPACASFDMFENYKDRGEKFKNLAKQW